MGLLSMVIQAHLHRSQRAIIKHSRGDSNNTSRRIMPEFVLRIENMHCGSCIRRVSRALASTKGLLIEEVRIGAARVSSSQNPAPVDQALDALAKAGYPAQLETQ
jgi:Cu+-exporting ATPase